MPRYRIQNVFKGVVGRQRREVGYVCYLFSSTRGGRKEVVGLRGERESE